ncbi:MAG: SpoIIE family protein phosphatase [Lachnospiraceae bacterium]|nr:SpoIIE family protein phosphatase [Lachnospiraceae bacterium]
MNNNRKKDIRSVGDKITAATFFSSLFVLISAILIMTVILLYTVWQISSYTVRNLAYSVAEMTDGEKMEELAGKVLEGEDLASVDNDPYIRKLYEESANILNQYINIKAFSFVAIRPETGEHVYIMECEPGGDELKAGDVENISYLFNEETEKKLLAGERFGTWYKKVEPYGHLILAAEPIKNDGKIVAYLITDVFLNEILKSAGGAIVAAFIFLSLLIGINMYLGRRYFNKNLVEPINQITDAAREYLYEEDSEAEIGSEEIPGSFSKLNIHTGDELEQLAGVMKKLEMDLDRYIRNLTSATAEKQRIATEFELANSIQTNAMPNIFPVFPDHNDFEAYAITEPAKEVGGDFYDFLMLDDTHIALVVADVSGKGIPAALFMMIAKTIIKNQAGFTQDPAEILENSNEQLCDSNIESMFVTVWLAVIDIAAGELTYSLAGHERPIIKQNGCWECRKSRAGMPLGAVKGIKYKNETLKLSSGDIIFEYSDGVTEAKNAGNEMYGRKRFLDVLNQTETNIPNRIISSVRSDIKEFVGDEEQFDDITMLVFCYRKQEKEYNADIFEEKQPIVDLELDNIREEITDGVIKRYFKHTYKATIDNIYKAQAMMMELTRPLNPSEKVLTVINIVLDEMLGNIDKYAYSEGGSGTVDVEGILNCSNKELTIKLSDYGAAFDPVQKIGDSPDNSENDTEFTGLGIFVAASRVDSMKYERKDNMNILTMTKSLKEDL